MKAQKYGHYGQNPRVVNYFGLTVNRPYRFAERVHALDDHRGVDEVPRAKRAREKVVHLRRLTTGLQILNSTRTNTYVLEDIFMHTLLFIIIF